MTSSSSRQSTSYERAAAVRISELLEQAPLAENAYLLRKWLARWLDQVTDINVPVLAVLAKAILGDNREVGPVLVSQIAFSSAAFMIQNPERAADQEAICVAGVEGSLRAYEVIRSSQPDSRIPAMDELKTARETRSLGNLLRRKMRGHD